jgi:hypothetical protein
MKKIKNILLSLSIFVMIACSTSPMVNKNEFKPVPSITSVSSLTIENCDKLAWVGAFEFGSQWDDAPIYIKGEGSKTIELKAGDYRVFRYYDNTKYFPEYKDITIKAGTANMVSLGCDD